MYVIPAIALFFLFVYIAWRRRNLLFGIQSFNSFVDPVPSFLWQRSPDVVVYLSSLFCQARQVVVFFFALFAFYVYNGLQGLFYIYTHICAPFFFALIIGV